MNAKYCFTKCLKSALVIRLRLLYFFTEKFHRQSKPETPRKVEHQSRFQRAVNLGGPDFEVWFGHKK